MCGIFCALTQGEGTSDSFWDHHQWIQTRALLRRRGPDREAGLQCPAQSDPNGEGIVAPTGRPIFHAFATLLWLRGREATAQPVRGPRGDVLLWNGDIFGDEVQPDECDTLVLFHRLENAEDEAVVHVLAQISGPYAFIYFRPRSSRLWFGRDSLGRHSLILSRPASPTFFLSSVIDPAEAEGVELPAWGLFTCRTDEVQPSSILLHPWVDRAGTTELSHLDPRFKASPITLNGPLHPRGDGGGEEINPPAVLELRGSPAQVLGQYLEHHEPQVRELQTWLTRAIALRAQSQPPYCRACLPRPHAQLPPQSCGHARVGVLFSGGLDSTVIAALLDRVLEPGLPVDLVNVAFQAEESGGQFRVPDRLTGLQALAELQAMCPRRPWHFRTVNVTKAELVAERQSRIRSLLYPLQTVLDDSIGCALWFAARGQSQSDCSQARVLLLGMGADEQLGGYSRHRVRYQTEGYPGLADELLLEMNRISERNLGRDNRILSDHGIAGRMPYLDEAVVNFLASTPVLTRTRLDLPRGLGDKILLRALAFQLGLEKTALEPKRAIQFGSRIAKLEKRKEKGSDAALRQS
eukprot:maker-scaffold205_size259573-snap-gene-1.40 protein:Tk01392 transcript:maker-scaffold205_size259573-snap-gene-1.40-mRNA-1 annotation:"hypothetical protein DAPPUDRAFT_57150"